MIPRNISLQKLTKSELQQIKNLTLESKERKAHQQVVVYGSVIIEELPPGTDILFIFTTESKSESYDHILETRDTDHYVCSEDEFQKVSSQKAPEGIGAVIALPEQSNLSSLSSLLILDQIQDPGNLGTLVRSGYALGMEGILFVKGGCDPFSDKALRASQGAIFQLPYSIMDQDELHEFIKTSKIHPLVADMTGEPIEHYLQTRSTPKVALVLGNEGQGVLSADPHWKRVSIPMQGNAESLNVAIAGSILMYLLHQKPFHGRDDASL